MRRRQHVSSDLARRGPFPGGALTIWRRGRARSVVVAVMHWAALSVLALALRVWVRLEPWCVHPASMARANTPVNYLKGMDDISIADSLIYKCTLGPISRTGASRPTRAAQTRSMALRNAAAELDAEWRTSPRWQGITRRYAADDVVRLRGSLQVEYTLASRGAERLWQLLHTEDYVPTLGALTGNQAVQQVKAGLQAIYLSGWQVAADANLAGQM